MIAAEDISGFKLLYSISSSSPNQTHRRLTLRQIRSHTRFLIFKWLSDIPTNIPTTQVFFAV